MSPISLLLTTTAVEILRWLSNIPEHARDHILRGLENPELFRIFSLPPNIAGRFVKLLTRQETKMFEKIVTVRLKKPMVSSICHLKRIKKTAETLFEVDEDGDTF